MSQLKQIGAMTRLNIRLQLTDPAPTLILTVIPLVLIPFMMPAFKSMLLADGYAGVTGAEQAVPSIAILFSFLAVQNIIGSFFNERSWGTWERLEASPTSRASILTGKALVAFLMQTVQIAVVLALGALDLRVSTDRVSRCARRDSPQFFGGPVGARRRARTVVAQPRRGPVPVEHHRHAGGRHRRFFLHGLFVPRLGAARRAPVPRLLGDHRDSRGEPGRGETCRRRGADRRPVGFLRGDRGAGTDTVPVSQGVMTTEAESPCRRHASARYRETSSCRARSTWSTRRGSPLCLCGLWESASASPRPLFIAISPTRLRSWRVSPSRSGASRSSPSWTAWTPGRSASAATPTHEASEPTEGTPASPLLAYMRAYAHCLASTLRSHPGAVMLLLTHPMSTPEQLVAPGARVRDAGPARFHAECGHAGAGQRGVDLHDGLRRRRGRSARGRLPRAARPTCRPRAPRSIPRTRRRCARSSRISWTAATTSTPSLSGAWRRSCAAGTEANRPALRPRARCARLRPGRLVPRAALGSPRSGRVHRRGVRAARAMSAGLGARTVRPQRAFSTASALNWRSNTRPGTIDLGDLIGQGVHHRVLPAVVHEDAGARQELGNVEAGRAGHRRGPPATWTASGTPAT